MKNITVKEAKEALKYIKQFVPARPKIADDRELSLREAILFMAEDLIRKSKEGCTVKELVACLALKNIQIKPGTLSRYLNEYMAAKKGENKSVSPVRREKSNKEKIGFEPAISSPQLPNTSGLQGEICDPLSPLMSKIKEDLDSVDEYVESSRRSYPNEPHDAQFYDRPTFLDKEVNYHNREQ